MLRLFVGEIVFENRRVRILARVPLADVNALAVGSPFQKIDKQLKEAARLDSLFFTTIDLELTLP